MRSGKFFGILLIGAAILGSLSLFTVSETEHAIRFRFKEIINDTFDPGLHFKWPWETVLKLDNRILTVDEKPSEFLTEQKEKVFVDFFVKWKIVDPSMLYRTTDGSEAVATKRLMDNIEDGLKDEFAQRELIELVSVERSTVMDEITAEANEQAQKFGIDIVDVRIKRIDLSSDVSETVYRRMREERKRVANQRRAEGVEESERIRSTADKDRTVILAEAYKLAEQIRGEGDAVSAEVYANAYNKNREFFSFVRSMQAYRRSLGQGQDVMVLKPDSDFFKYLNESRAGE